jgi:hypothetical protein
VSRRRKCWICKTGTGCRTRGHHGWALCSLCGHPCRSHQPAYLDIIPAYCFFPKGEKCSCPGWPIEAKKSKPRKRKEDQREQSVTT